MLRKTHCGGLKLQRIRVHNRWILEEGLHLIARAIPPYFQWASILAIGKKTFLLGVLCVVQNLQRRANVAGFTRLLLTLNIPNPKM